MANTGYVICQMLFMSGNAQQLMACFIEIFINLCKIVHERAIFHKTTLKRQFYSNAQQIFMTMKI